MSDSAKTFRAGQTTWTVNIECMFDDTDSTGQEAMTIGATVSVNLGPEGAGTGAYQYSGSAIVTGFGAANAKGSEVTRNFTLQGNGALTIGTYS